MTKDIIDELIEFVRKRPAGRGFAAHAIWLSIWSAIITRFMSIPLMLIPFATLISALKKVGEIYNK